MPEREERAEKATREARKRKTAMQRLRPLIVLLILLSVVLLVYPTAASLWNERRQQQIITAYQEACEAALDYSGERARAEAYNEALARKDAPMVTVETMECKDDAEYESLLDIAGNGAMGYLDIPKIALSLPVYHYYTEDNTTGLGHLYGSSLPVGGEGTHAIIAAHRGLPSAKLFTNLDQLEIGDKFYLHVLGETLAYQVDEIRVVLPTEVETLRIDPEGDYVTLMTCTPYAVNTHRLLVRGTRISYEGETTESGSVAKRVAYQIDRNQWIGAGVLLFLLLLIAAVSKAARRKNKKQTGKQGVIVSPASEKPPDDHARE